MNYRDAPPSGPRPGPFDGGPLRRVLEILIVVGVIGAIGGAVFWVFTRKAAPPPVDYGALTPFVRTLEGNVEKNTCDLESTVKLVRAYNECSDYHGTVSRAELYEGKCGVNAKVLYYRAEAHRHLHEYGAALTQANRVVDLTHLAGDILWRGDIHREFGKPALALADYQKALELAPTSVEALNGVVGIHEAEKRPCDAATALKAYINANGDPGGLQQRADAFRGQCK